MRRGHFGLWVQLGEFVLLHTNVLHGSVLDHGF